MFNQSEIEQIQERIKLGHPGSCIPLWIFNWMQESIQAFPPGSKIVELGTFVGGTTRLLAQTNPDKEVHSVDLNVFDDTFINFGILNFIKNRFGLENLTAEKILHLQKIHVSDLNNVFLYTGESTSIEVENISIAIVDDNKDEDGMLQNLEFLWPRMIEGGIIFGDDIDSPQIYNAFVKFAKQKNIEITFYSKAAKLIKKDNIRNYRELNFQDTLVFNCPKDLDISNTTASRY